MGPEAAKRPYERQILVFTNRTKKTLAPRAIVLYGSLARGDFHQGSDADILVVSDNLPRNPLERSELLDSFAPRELPLQALAYTPDEFERMIRERHPTALSALEEGVVLYDDGFYRRAGRIYRAVRKKTRLRRTATGWVSEIGKVSQTEGSQALKRS